MVPKRFTLLTHIPKGLVAWYAAHRAFQGAGGTALDDHRVVGAFMRLLPDEVKQKAPWEWEKFVGKPIAFRRWARECAKLLVNRDLASHKSVHALEDHQSGDVDESELEGLHSYLPRPASGGTVTKEELHAFFRRKVAGYECSTARRRRTTCCTSACS